MAWQEMFFITNFKYEIYGEIFLVQKDF